jgi:hypothetical protein
VCLRSCGRDVREPCGFDRRVPDHPAPVAQTQRRARRSGQEQVVGLPAFAAAGKRLDEFGGQRDGALLVGLGRAEDQLAGHLRRRFGDCQALA